MDKILRASWHDYKSRCIYMVTLKKSPMIKAFGSLAGDCRIPVGEKGSSFIIPSEVGRSIKKVINRFQLIEPKIKILQYSIMPDHVHMIVKLLPVNEEHISSDIFTIVRSFKRFCYKKIEKSIWQNSFYDHIIRNSTDLSETRKYIKGNPARWYYKNHPNINIPIDSQKI